MAKLTTNILLFFILVILIRFAERAELLTSIEKNSMVIVAVILIMVSTIHSKEV